MTTLTTLLAAYVLAKLGLGLLNWAAPLGWQDRDGFHLGTPGPTHQHPSRDSSERHRGGRVDQHHEAR